MRTELVTDALGMAIIRRQPDKRADGKSTILHSDHGAQYTSWAFGQRLRAAGLLASMGTIGDCYDNSMMESFWGTLQLELPFAAEDEAHDVPSFDPETFLPRENTRPISTPTS